MNRGNYRGSRTHPVVWVIGLSVVFLLLAFGTLELIINFGGKTNVTGNEKVMVILGAQVKTSGPSVLLKDRLDTALIYLNANPTLTVVVSGGQGDNEPATEASVMGDYLIEHGYPADQILLEDTSRNTAQNIQNTVALLKQQNIDATDGVIIVSNRFHIFRAKMLGERYGMKVSTLAAPSSHVGAGLKGVLREPFGVIKSFLFD
ncbi:MAG: YdcF family protein [Oscillospiraceae bacterium]